MKTRYASVPPVVVAGALAPLPFLYGAVHLPARLLYVAIAAVLLLAHVWLRISAKRRVAPRGVATVALVLALVWAGLAIVPIPAELLHSLSTRTWELAVQNPGRAGIAPPAWHAIAVDPELAIEGWVTAAAHLSIFAVASASFAGRRGARTFAAMLALTGAAIAVLGIVQALTGATRIFWIGLSREQFYGTFVNGNHTASLLAACCMAGLGLLLRERDPGKRAAWGVAAVVCAMGVMHSLSRGGIIALAIGLGAFLAGAIATQAHAKTKSPDELGRFFRRHAVLLMLVALAVFYLSWLGPQRIGRELATLAALDLPQDYRTRVWLDARRMLVDWPFTGAGSGNFGEVFAGYRTFFTDVRTEMAESDVVQVAVENGLVGLGLVIAAVIAVLGKFGARYAGDPMRFSGAHLGLGAGLLVLCSHSCVDFPLRLPAMGALAAAMAGALAGAVARTRAVGPRRKPVRHAHRARALLWVTLPVASLLLAPMVVAAEQREPDVARSPADARAWLRLPGDAAWATALRLDPSRPEVHRLVAARYAKAGNALAAAGALRGAVDLLEREGGAGQTTQLAKLRVELAEQLALAGQFAEAEAQLAKAGEQGGPRRLLVKAELMAVRDDAPFSARNAVDAFDAAARALAASGDAAAAAAARERALLIAVNAARAMPAAEARDWLDVEAKAGDPGAALREYSALAASGALDAKAIWDGRPRISLEDFSTGSPRLTPAAPEHAGAVVEHALTGGTEKLLVRYPDASTITDVWQAPLGLHSAERALALRIVMKADGRLGDQACATSEGRRVFGQAGEASADGWRSFVVPGLVTSTSGLSSLDAWCLDTRGRPGPFFIREVSLILEE